MYFSRAVLAVGFLGMSFLHAAKPTVLFTDIGGDVDDTWAVAHILRSPELDLKLIVTETGESEYRGRVTAKLLEAAKRTDIHVGLGLDFGVMPDKERHQGPWVKGYELENYPGQIHKDGIKAFYDLVDATEEKVIVIAIGPALTLAKAVSDNPKVAVECDLFGMYGSFRIGYDGSKELAAEYNVADNPKAFRAVMEAPWNSITLTPLDTCGLFSLKGDNYAKIWSSMDDPLLQAVIENYCIWAPRVPWIHCDFFTERSSTLFDDVAVYMAYDGSLLNYETLRFSVDDKGFTKIDEDGPYAAKVATSWIDMDAFESFLSHRLLGLDI
ncbi:MAG: nucleoside hydrolase [Verrucomicrobiota bacterium]